MSEIRVTSVLGENGSDPVGLSTGFTVGPTSGTTATITHEGQASFTGIVTATSFVPTVGQLSHRNLVTNGDMGIAQRGTSSTAIGKKTIDMFQTAQSTTDETPQQAQADVASGTTPYTLGFRKSFKVTNGNQTSGAQAGSIIAINYRFEAQDIANSGWNYTSSSSYVTLSFWVKSSVAQNFYGYLRTYDGTAYGYPFETGSLSADTWTKITKTIAGNSNLQFDNDVDQGLRLVWNGFLGTDRTDNSATLNQWGVYSGSARTPDNTSTWYTTNDATFEITGVQLEVGPVATPFEHRSRTDEFARCQRRYQQYVNISAVGYVPDNSSRSYSHGFFFPVEMRAAPTLSIENTGSSNGQYCGDGDTNRYISSVLSQGSKTTHMSVSFNLSGDLSNFRGAYLHGTGNTSYQTTYKIDAEL